MSEIFHTPPEAIDVVLANPPIGNLPSGADGTEAGDGNGAPASGEARHMSIPEASGILMELARKRSMSIDQVNALEMAVRRLMRRHFQRQRNWAKRREARRLAEDGSPHQVVPEVPAVSEVPEVPAVPARPEEEAAR